MEKFAEDSGSRRSMLIVRQLTVAILSFESKSQPHFRSGDEGALVSVGSRCACDGGVSCQLSDVQVFRCSGVKVYGRKGSAARHYVITMRMSPLLIHHRRFQGDDSYAFLTTKTMVAASTLGFFRRKQVDPAKPHTGFNNRLV